MSGLTVRDNPPTVPGEYIAAHVRHSKKEVLVRVMAVNKRLYWLYNTSDCVFPIEDWCFQRWDMIMSLEAWLEYDPRKSKTRTGWTFDHH